MTPQKAQQLFLKLQDKWGISNQGYAWPIGYRNISKTGSRNMKNFFRADWMSILEKDYIRPTFEEFLDLYKIELRGNI